MATRIFEYRSTGKKHEDEAYFFKFIVRNKFQNEDNNAYQWCAFKGTTVIVEALEPEIIDFARLVLTDTIESNSGHRWELVNK